MTEGCLDGRSPTTLLTVFAMLSIAGDVVLLTFCGIPQGIALVLVAKYPGALALGVMVTGGRRLVTRAAEICAEDLRD